MSSLPVLWWLGRTAFLALLMGFVFQLYRALAVSGEASAESGRAGRLTLEAVDESAEVWLKEGAGKQRRLTPGAGVPLRGRLEIGRGPDNHLRVIDPFVSAKHCVVRRVGKQFILADLGTTNGTIVNDQPVKGRIPLDPGTTIDVGQARFRFEVK